MAEGHDGFFWDNYPWVMSNGSSSASDGGDNKIISIAQTNQPAEMGDTDGDCQDMAASGKNDTSKEVSVVEKGKEKVEKGREAGSRDYELHILTERERRKKMRDMFYQLHALMPHLPHKTDKTTIVDEAIGYIKTLQQTLQELERKKLERLYGQSTNVTGAFRREWILADQGSSCSTPLGKVSSSGATSLSFPLSSPKVFQTWVSSNVTLSVCGSDAHFSICASHNSGLLTAICLVLEKHKLEVVSAQIDSDESKSLFMIHVKMKACHQFIETIGYDEIYKQAAAEITHWVNSKSL